MVTMQVIQVLRDNFVEIFGYISKYPIIAAFIYCLVAFVIANFAARQMKNKDVDKISVKVANDDYQLADVLESGGFTVEYRNDNWKTNETEQSTEQQ